MSEELTCLTDKNGVQQTIDCVINESTPSETEKHYFNIGLRPNDGSTEMVASTYGYVHNVKQSDVANFEYVGLVNDNLHLLECD